MLNHYPESHLALPIVLCYNGQPDVIVGKEKENRPSAGAFTSHCYLAPSLCGCVLCIPGFLVYGALLVCCNKAREMK